MDNCNEYLGPFRCELGLGHRGAHQFDSNPRKRNMNNDFQDALMFLRIFLTRKDMATVDCLKLKVVDWMKRKGYQPSILREAERQAKGEQR